MITLFDQEVLHDPANGLHGDCMRACVYSLVGRHLGLPHPIRAPEGKRWNHGFFDALEDAGFDFHTYFVRPGRDYEHLPRLVIAGGPTVRTERTGATHAVLWDRIACRCVHDPHPDRAGIIEPTTFYWLTEVTS